uniref:Uncharacterized protein n=1 Tax=Glossina brevipalpis TaxID=37001 RepID=A0A1A9WQ43_9MUSC
MNLIIVSSWRLIEYKGLETDDERIQIKNYGKHVHEYINKEFLYITQYLTLGGLVTVNNNNCEAPKLSEGERYCTNNCNIPAKPSKRTISLLPPLIDDGPVLTTLPIKIGVAVAVESPGFSSAIYSLESFKFNSPIKYSGSISTVSRLTFLFALFALISIIFELLDTGVDGIISGKRSGFTICILLSRVVVLMVVEDFG